MSRRTPDTRSVGLLGLLRLGAFLVLFGALAGFAVFSSRVAGMPVPDRPDADAIVVLTGGDGRLQSAAALLDDHHGARLLISGVHPDVTEAELIAAMDADAARFGCCVDLGREAVDTAGNAREIAAWVEANNYQSIIVVTSDYHLPRSLLELGAHLPDTTFVAFPVRTDRPWSSLRSTQRWSLEYLKYIAVLAREFAAGRA
tara:strand:- start:7443 stop:8045 length:603 start_codon:yes stop_codon:yes gene_type:complete